MSYEKRVDRFFFHQFFEHLLRNFKLLHRGLNFHAQLAAFSNLSLARAFEPAAINCADYIGVAGSTPRTLQTDRLSHCSITVAMLDIQRSDYRFGKVADEFFHEFSHLLEIGISPINLQHGKLGIVSS